MAGKVGRPLSAAPPDDQLLTKNEAAALLGIHKVALMNYIRNGRLVPARQGKVGDNRNPSLFRRADVEALYPLTRAGRRARMLQSDEAGSSGRRCTRCGESKERDAFSRDNNKGLGGLRSICKSCAADYHREYLTRADPAVLAARREVIDKWSEEHREACRRFSRESLRRRSAIAFAKTAPFTKSTFTLARQDEEWHCFRRDRPLPAGWTPIAVFERLDGRWFVEAHPGAPKDRRSVRLLRYLQRNEERAEAKSSKSAPVSRRAA